LQTLNGEITKKEIGESLGLKIKLF
jgi:hypothetical protein